MASLRVPLRGSSSKISLAVQAWIDLKTSLAVGSVKSCTDTRETHRWGLARSQLQTHPPGRRALAPNPHPLGLPLLSFTLPFMCAILVCTALCR